MQATYDTALAIAEIRREALVSAEGALGAKHGVSLKIQALLEEWREPPEPALSGVDEKIQEFRKAREVALRHAERCSAVLEEAAAELGEDHPLSRQLIEAATFFG